MMPKESNIISIKTINHIKDTKRKHKKKVLKKKPRMADTKDKDHNIGWCNLELILTQLIFSTEVESSKENPSKDVPLLQSNHREKEGDENKRKESINIDSLINAYKEKAAGLKNSEDKMRGKRLSVDENITPVKAVQRKERTEEGERSKPPPKSNIHIGEMQVKEKKVKSVTIKSKHRETREDRTSKILLPYVKVEMCEKL